MGRKTQKRVWNSSKTLERWSVLEEEMSEKREPGFLLLFQLLVVKLSDLDDRRGCAE